MAEEANAILPFEEIGGSAAVRALVDRFYDLMEQDPRFAELRAMHARDLAPMRDSLCGFLTAWLGGPRDWFTEHPGVCMMSAHRRLNFGAAEATQWTGAMREAFDAIDAPAALEDKVNDAFMRMGRAMQAA